MRISKAIATVVLTILVLAVAGLRTLGRLQAAPAAASEQQNTKELLQAFASVDPIDAHVHAYSKDDPGFFGMLKSLNLHIVNILVVGDDPGLWAEFAVPEYVDLYSKGLEPQRSDALAVVRASGGRAVLCTTFDPYKFRDPKFAEQAIEQLDKDFDGGAVAVKIWKNIGMEIRKADGSFLMADDPIFAPIYKDIEKHQRTLIAHLAEPDTSWRPPNPDDPDYTGYFKNNPRWYMYLHPDYPSKNAILAAQDRILQMNRGLRYVGAHMGCMESDVDQIAKRFDQYPNFSVETAGRLYALMIQPREKVQAFLTKYQDRVLYGTDLILQRGAKKGAFDQWSKTYARDWGLFATDQTFDLEGRKIRGLKLPNSVVRKILHDNALKWIPGIAGN
jgi:hypothetical protein